MGPELDLGDSDSVDERSIGSAKVAELNGPIGSKDNFAVETRDRRIAHAKIVGWVSAHSIETGLQLVSQSSAYPLNDFHIRGAGAKGELWGRLILLVAPPIVSVRLCAITSVFKQNSLIRDDDVSILPFAFKLNPINSLALHLALPDAANFLYSF
jgi:hypothetical protein